MRAEKAFCMKVILFDGVCNLCNGTVYWVIARDIKNQFHFASLQSPFGKQVLQNFGLADEYMNSIIFLDNNEIYMRSSAVLRILKHLGSFYQTAYVFILIPEFLRNAVYNFIAKNRYRWFGKKETCMVPTPKLKSKFIE